MYFFDVISMGQKLTLFQRSFFDVILMNEKLTSFLQNLFEVTSMSESTSSFQCTFRPHFDGQKINVVSV